MRIAVLLVALSVLSACTHGGPWPPASSLAGALLPLEPARAGGFVVKPAEGAAIGYSGELTQAGLKALQVADAADGERATTLLIRSNGSEAMVGVRFGEWVHARGLDVVVVDYCLSGCANYVFPAGRQKTILPGAIVAWHGDVHMRRFRPVTETRRGGRDLAVEEAFFRELGVAECLCRVGDDSPLGAPTIGRWRRWQGFFTLSPEDMARFGVENVTTSGQRQKDVSPALWRWLNPHEIEIPPDMDVRTACR
jgi:hypothetical protein